jgi:hypothetical protein
MISKPLRSHAAPFKGLVFSVGMVLAAGALAATPRAAASPETRYQKEAGLCMALRPSDERDTCLDGAYGRLLNTRPTPLEELAYQLKANALKRCEPLPEPLRKDCVERMSGGGSQTGSVSQGGIYRELVTVEVGPRPAAKPAEPPTPLPPPAPASAAAAASAPAPSPAPPPVPTATQTQTKP